MSERGSLILHRIIGILVAVSIISAGICLAAGCCYIYFSDSIEYSRIAVSDVFEVICIPVYICLALVVIGFLTEVILPHPLKTKKGITLSAENRLKNLLKKRDPSSLNNGFLKVHCREKGKRTINYFVMTVLTLIACTVFFVYALNKSNFDGVDINGSVISALYVLAPCVIVPFAFYLYLIIDKERGYKRETEALKNADAENSESIGTDGPKFENFDLLMCKLGRYFDASASAKKLFAVRAILISAALLSLVFGLAFGGTADVFTKASNICTECIGLG